MRVNQHITQGFFISLILGLTVYFITLNHVTRETVPFFLVLLIFPYFILLGSIYPDVDIKESWKVKTHNKLAFVYSLFKVLIAYPLRWLVYYPSYWTIKKILPQRYTPSIKDEHHNTTHTFLGIGVAFLYLFLWNNFLYFLINKHNYNSAQFVMGILISVGISIGFLVGCLIHFIQDAYSGHGNSAYGISPLKPFKNISFYGDYSSYHDMNSRDKVMSILIFLLLLLIPWISDYIYKTAETPIIITTILCIFTLSILVIIFSAYAIEFRMRIRTDHSDRLLKKFFVVTIVAAVLINLGLYIFFL